VTFNSRLRVLSSGSFSVVLLAFFGLILIVPVSVNTETMDTIDSKTALLIIDVQEFYFPGGAVPLEGPEAAALNCKKLLIKYRDKNKNIIHIGHKVSKGGSFQAEVMPRDGEKIIMKSEVSAFKGTQLHEFLEQHKIKQLVICGMQTHMCVEAAVRAANDLGYECILIHDACATRTLKFEDIVIDAVDVHNSTLSSLDRTYATVIDTETFLENYLLVEPSN
jgi:nicotinamidase-related amidase